MDGRSGWYLLFSRQSAPRAFPSITGCYLGQAAFHMLVGDRISSSSSSILRLLHGAVGWIPRGEKEFSGKGKLLSKWNSHKGQPDLLVLPTYTHTHTKALCVSYKLVCGIAVQERARMMRDRTQEGSQRTHRFGQNVMDPLPMSVKSYEPA